MHDAVSLEDRGIPTAVVVTSDFLLEAHTQSAALGMPRLEPAVIDHPLSTLKAEEIVARADQALGQVKEIWAGAAVGQLSERPARSR